MNELTVKTNEIRRLHAVCRAQRDAVQQALCTQVRHARSANWDMIRARTVRRYCDDDTRRWILRELRDEYLHAARVLKDVLKALEG